MQSRNFEFQFIRTLRVRISRTYAYFDGGSWGRWELARGNTSIIIILITTLIVGEDSILGNTDYSLQRYKLALLHVQIILSWSTNAKSLLIRATFERFKIVKTLSPRIYVICARFKFRFIKYCFSLERIQNILLKGNFSLVLFVLSTWFTDLKRADD